jgi:hypothetical protein
MIIIVGLVILVAAVVAGVAGVLSNGSGHAVAHPFGLLGYHVTGTTGTVFLDGIVVGAVGLLGLSVLLAGARRTSRRGQEARRGLKQSRRETAAVSQDRDDLLGQREAARTDADTAASPGSPNGFPHQSSGRGQLRRWWLAQRPAPAQRSADPPPETLTPPPAAIPAADNTPPDPSADEGAAALPA